MSFGFSPLVAAKAVRGSFFVPPEFVLHFPKAFASYLFLTTSEGAEHREVPNGLFRHITRRHAKLRAEPVYCPVFTTQTD